jgi:hypothetical protein
MPNCLQFALSNPFAGAEDEFYRWYGSDHLQHGVLVPGVLAGQRFRRARSPWPDGKHDYLMIWEFDDPAYALEQLAAVKNSPTMPISPAIDMAGVQPPTMWRRATVRSHKRISAESGSRGPVVLLLANAKDGADEHFAQAIIGGGLAALADRPGVLSAEFLTLADEQIRGNARKYRFALLIELAAELEGLASLERALPDLPHLEPEKWLAPVFEPIGERLTKIEARVRREGRR